MSTTFYKFYEKSYEPILFGVQLIKATIFVTKKILVFLNLETQRFKMARDKVHLNYGKSQTIRNFNYALAHTWFYYGEITLPAFKPNSKIQQVTRAVAK
jgi:hypothetical protein